MVKCRSIQAPSVMSLVLKLRAAREVFEVWQRDLEKATITWNYHRVQDINDFAAVKGCS